jgi:general secretion pathway protein F
MKFRVRALKPGVGVVDIRLEASDEPAATERAREQGLAVLSVRRAGGFAGLQSPFAARFPLLQFAQELTALSQAGLSLPETLDTMVEKEARQDLRMVLSALRDRIFQGQSFSQALQAHPQVFPALFVASVRASERTGDLSEALQRYVEYHERLDVVRKKVVSASIYPVVLLCVGALVTLFLLGYVVPRFSAIYAESGRELPWMSRLLMQWGRLTGQHGAMLVAVLGILVAGAIVMGPKLWTALRRLASRVPAVRSRLMVYHLARLYRTLGMLLRGGIPIVPALGMVSGLFPPELRAALSGARGLVAEGVSLSEAMGRFELTTPVAARMLRVGENSGDMPAMMDRIAGFHDEELSRWVDWFTKLFEPLLMALIGVVVGAIVVLMYMPIFELASSLE